jgi:hypothetical protein
VSLLGDAQQIERDGPPQYSDIWLCCQRLVEKGHAADCHWLSMPQIVAVIDAAGRLVDRFDSADKREANDLVNALVAALKGTSVPA